MPCRSTRSSSDERSGASTSFIGREPSLRREPPILGEKCRSRCVFCLPKIDERDRMGGPRQIIPGPLLHRSHAARPSATSTARVAPPAAFQMHSKSTGPCVVRTLKGLHPKSGHAQNPRTIAPRSHASSLVGTTSRENDTGWSVPRGISTAVVQAAEQTAHPSTVRAGGRVLRQLLSTLSLASLNAER